MNITKPYRIFAQHLEQQALDQFESAMQQDYVSQGALMPDAHAGYSLPIGAVVATHEVVVPAWVGYDIGCGVCALPTTFNAEQVKLKDRKIFDEIYKTIPVGFNHNQENSDWEEARTLPHSDTLAEIFAKNGLRQLGSLGGGNHFIEIGFSFDGQVWIIIHSGSRGIGHAVAAHYMRLASGDGKAREGHFGLHEDSLVGQDYIADMRFCLAFALRNREIMLHRVVRAMQLHTEGIGSWHELINRNHNHADKHVDGRWIHRKGATHAEEGMLGVVPGNMLDGSFIVRGKGNPDALWSSSHGAGRTLGRKEAQRTLDLEVFKEDMAGVMAKVDSDTLDESPRAYKNIFSVMNQQTELVEIQHHIIPFINIKG